MTSMESTGQMLAKIYQQWDHSKTSTRDYSQAVVDLEVLLRELIKSVGLCINIGNSLPDSAQLAQDME